MQIFLVNMTVRTEITRPVDHRRRQYPQAIVTLSM